jgi:hypothetical protein
MRTHSRIPLIALIVATTVLGLGSSALSAGFGAEKQSVPVRFSANVDNPWFPLEPGTTYTYRGVKDGQAARDVLTVTHRTATINGAPCVVVKDRLYLDGRLKERTTDWYTQDSKGNVWYFGETTAELDASGKIKSTTGSWRAGVHEAKAGIYMPAHPRPGQSGRQEFLKGQAEDHFRVLNLNTRVSVPYVTSSHALLTEEWTPLEPGKLDHKLYVRGIGTVLEKAVKGGDERLALVAVDRGT